MITPLFDCVVVRPVEAKAVTESGIYLPTNVETLLSGEVVSLGPGMADGAGGLITADAVAGDLVLFGKAAGIPYVDGVDKLLIMRQRDLLAVVK